MEMATKYKKIHVENKTYQALKEDPRHIWNVKLNPANGVYTVHNEKADIKYDLMGTEFVRGQICFNEKVLTFPEYIHMQVWMLMNYAHDVRRNK